MEVSATQNLMSKHNQNKDFLKIYHKEKEAFIQKYGNEEAKKIGYFLEDMTPELIETQQNMSRPHAETIAEINALLSAPQDIGTLAMRTHILMENFPETIAFVAKLLKNF